MYRKIFWWLLIIAWCVMIFFQLDKPAVTSGQESTSIVAVVNAALSSVFGPDIIIVSDRAVRKTAHFLEYMVLGCLLVNGFKRARLHLSSIIMPFAVGVLYAVSDEVHQYFVPGRAMMAFDVLIDSLGLLTGVLLLYFLFARKKAAWNV